MLNDILKLRWHDDIDSERYVHVQDLADLIQLYRRVFHHSLDESDDDKDKDRQRCIDEVFNLMLDRLSDLMVDDQEPSLDPDPLICDMDHLDTRILEIIIASSHCEHIDRDSAIFEVMEDDIDKVNLICDLEHEFTIIISDDIDWKCVGDIIDTIKSKL